VPGKISNSNYGLKPLPGVSLLPPAIGRAGRAAPAPRPLPRLLVAAFAPVAEHSVRRWNERGKSSLRHYPRNKPKAGLPARSPRSIWASNVQWLEKPTDDALRCPCCIPFHPSNRGLAQKCLPKTGPRGLILFISGFSKAACKYFNYFGPWIADVQGPLLNSCVMNVIATTVTGRPVKNLAVARCNGPS
jgi:hypothetical protein